MTATRPKPGDLVVVVQEYPGHVMGYARGRTVPLLAYGRETSFPWIVGMLDLRWPVHDVRPATPEEQAAYWLEHSE